MSSTSTPPGGVNFVINGGSPIAGTPGTTTGTTATWTYTISSLSASATPYTVQAFYVHTGAFTDSDGGLSGGQTVNKASSTTTNNGVPSGAVYTGSAQGITGTTVTRVADSDTVATTTKYYDTHDTVDESDDTELSGAPIGAGSYKVVSIYDGDANHDDSKDTDYFTIAKAGSTTTNNGVPSGAVYTGSAQGITGTTVTRVADTDTVATTTKYYDTHDTVDESDDTELRRPRSVQAATRWCRSTTATPTTTTARTRTTSPSPRPAPRRRTTACRPARPTLAAPRASPAPR